MLLYRQAIHADSYSTVAELSTPGEGQQQGAMHRCTIIGFWRPHHKHPIRAYVNFITTEHFDGLHNNRSLLLRLTIIIVVRMKDIYIPLTNGKP
jgi:hypothetical protein